jgi:hypothetical protein
MKQMGYYTKFLIDYQQEAKKAHEDDCLKFVLKFLLFSTGISE